MNSTRTRVARLLIFAAIAVGVLSVSALARALWSQGGTGTTNAGSGSLVAPTSVVATPTPGSPDVPVTWTAVTGPDGGAVDGYYLQRYLGVTPSPACASSPTVLLSTTSCNDTSVPDGVYTYTVTAVFHSWTARSTPSAAITVVGLSSFGVTAPASTTAGTPFTLTITAKNQFGSTITGYLGSVHFVSSDPNAPILPADYTFVAGDNGVHTFSNGATLKTAPSQTVTVSAVTDNTKTGTATVNVTAGAAVKLRFTQQPGGGSGGVVWVTQPRVTVQDAFDNTVTTSSASVTLAITGGTGTPGAVLTCTANPKAAAAGVDSFAGCKINLAGSGYTLTATSAGLTTATSNSFDVVVGPATQVVYVQQPTAIVAGSLISPAVVAWIEDAGGNKVTSSSATVTMAISTNPGGGTLSGTLSVSASSGVVTFADLSIDKSGVGYKLTASSAGLTSAVSNTFNVTAGAAVKLRFTQQPGGGSGGVVWVTQPRVTVQDAFDNTVTTSSASVTLAITGGTGTPGAVLTCTANPKAAAAGVDSFAGCKINLAGSGYTLTATSAGLTTATSNSFDVVVGPATQVVYVQQPTAIVAGSLISPAVVAWIEDAGGNKVTSSSATVTMAISTNPGGGTLSGTLSVSASSGVVTFADLSIDKSGVGYKLTASSAGLTSAVSNTFNVTAGAAVKLRFTQQPGGGSGGVVWVTQPRVTVQDAFDNTVTTSSASVTLAITGGTGTPGAVLTCTANPKAAAAGVDSFAGCKINLAGSGYTLTATSAGLTTATSNSFDVVVGPATQVVYVQQPTAIVAGSLISPAVVAWIEDAGGNKVTSSSATVTMAISTNPGGGTLSGTLSVSASSGVVTFADLSIDKSGVGYKLTASSAGLTSAVSNTFNVTAGAAVKLRFTQQPGGGSGGVVWVTQPRVTVQDAFDNTVTTSSASVTLAITGGTGTPGAVLTCTANPKAAAAGVDSFAGCKINLAGSGYTLTATSAGLTTATSNSFTIS